jgi:hypothetical protein
MPWIVCRLSRLQDVVLGVMEEDRRGERARHSGNDRASSALHVVEEFMAMCQCYIITETTSTVFDLLILQGCRMGRI